MKQSHNRVITRLFSVVKNSIPTWLKDRTHSGFSQYSPGARYKNSYTKDVAPKVSEELLKRAKDGCEESEKFLVAIDNFRRPENTTMVTDNFPKDQKAANFLSMVMVTLFNRKLEVVETFLKETYLPKATHTKPHSDGSITRKDVQLTSINGIIADGTLS